MSTMSTAQIISKAQFPNDLPSARLSPASAKVLVSNKADRFRRPHTPSIRVDKDELKKKLTPVQYKVTQEKCTERPFSGEYLRLNDNGMYCCVVCDQELFSSECKFDSGCGWPAFSSTVNKSNVHLQPDVSHVGGNLLLLAMNQELARTEVTCSKCGSHVGHVFDDGPKPTGQRYCVNSASLKFKKLNTDQQARTNETKVLSSEKVREPVLPVVNKGNKEEPKKVDACPKFNFKTSFSNKTVGKDTSQTRQANNTAFVSTPLESQQRLNIFSRLRPISSQSREKSLDRVLYRKKSTDIKDENNNNVVVSAASPKYEGVQSRYLNHLNSLAKQSVVKNINIPVKSLMETHL